MAFIKDGILGGFSGKVGTVIGYRQGGRDIMQSLSDRSKKKNKSPELKTQQTKIGLASSFTRLIKSLLPISIRPAGNGLENRNFVVSQIAKYAIGGEHPNLFLDYSNVQLSHGSLPTVNKARVEQVEGGLLFNWIPNSLPGSTRSLDKALLVAYHADTKKVYFKIPGATRNDGSAVLPFTGKLSGDYETWLVFVSEKGNDASPTIYCGKLKTASPVVHSGS